MADRYWVGGSGSWDTSSTTNWSTTSGGSGGASVPTAADNVIFDSATTYTVTMTGALTCLDFTVSAGTVTFATGTTPTLTISGNISLVAATVWNSTGTVTFNATTSKTLNTNGVTFNCAVTFNGVGGTWTLQSNFTLAKNKITTLLQGTLAVSSYIYQTGIFDSTLNYTRGISWGSGGKIVVNCDITANVWYTESFDTGLTITGAYPLVEFTGGGVGVSKYINTNYGGQINYSILDSTGSPVYSFGTDGMVIVLPSTPNFVIDGVATMSGDINIGNSYTCSNTIGTPTFNSGTFVFSGTNANISINTNNIVHAASNWTLDGANCNFNLLSNANIGGRTTLNNGNLRLANLTLVTGAFTSNNTNVRQVDWGSSGVMVLRAEAATDLWNTNVMTNLTYTGSKVVYSNATGNFNRTYDFGSPDTGNLINFTINNELGSVTINNTSFNDLSVLANGMTLVDCALTIYGNYYNTMRDFGSPYSTWNFYPPSGTVRTISWLNAFSLVRPINIGNGTSNGTLQCNSALFGGNTWTLNSGTFDINNNSVRCNVFNSSGSAVRTLAFGDTGVLSIAGSNTTIWNTSTATNMTITGSKTVLTPINATTGTRTMSFGALSAASAFDFAWTPTATPTTNAWNIRNNSTDSLAISGAVGNFDLTSSNNTITNAARTIYGNLNIPATGPTIANGSSATTFATANTQTVNFNGRTNFTFPLTFSPTGTTRLLSAITIANTVSHTSGTLDFNDFTLTASAFSGTSGSNRTMAFGNTGQLTLTGSNATIVDISNANNFSYTGNARIVSTYASSVGTRTFALGNSTGFNTSGAANVSNMLDVSIGGNTNLQIAAGGTDSVSILGQVRNYNLTNVTHTVTNQVLSVFGNVSIPATGGTLTAGTNTLSMAGYSGNFTLDVLGSRALDFPVAFTGNGNYTVNNALIVGSNTVSSTKAVTLSQGNLIIANVPVYCGQFNSTNSNIRSISFGAGGNSKILLLNNNATLWDSATGANFSYTGNAWVESIYTGSTGTRTFNFGTLPELYTFDIKVAAGSAGFNLNTANDTVNIAGNIKGLDLTGFTGTFVNSAKNIHGNLVIPASGGTYNTGTTAISFTATSGNYTIDTGGRTLQFPLTFNGVGGNWTLANNLVANATTVLTTTNGTLDFNSKTLTFANITKSSGTMYIKNLNANVPIVHNAGTFVVQNGVSNSTTTGTYSLQGPPGGGILLVEGNLSTGAFSQTTGNITVQGILTCPSFSSNNASARSVNLTGGKIVLNGNTTSTIWQTANITNFTATGNGFIECIGGGTGVTKTISCGALSEANALSFRLLETTGNVTYSFTSNNSVRNLTLAGAQALTNVPIVLYGNLTYSNANGETRLTSGTSAWTFAATSGNYTITPASSNGIANTSSVYFNGSSAFLSLAGNVAFSIPTNTTPFTVEGWIYPTAAGGVIFSEQYTGTTNTMSIAVSLCDGTNVNTTTGQFIGFGWFNGTAWTTAAAANTAVLLNKWTHVACVFTGSNTRIYLDGVDVTKSATPTPSTTWGITGVNGDNWYIARRWDTTATAYFTGYISNFRFVKGNAVYSGAFTPPTLAPLATSGSASASAYPSTSNVDTTFAAANTSLLACQTLNSFTDNSLNNFTLTNNGTAITAIAAPLSTIYDFPWTVGNVVNTANWTLTHNLNLGPARVLTFGNVRMDFGNSSIQASSLNITNSTCLFSNTSSGNVRAAINQTNASVTLSSNFNVTANAGYTLTSGNLTLSNNVLTTASFSSTNTNTRNLAFGTGKIVLQGNSTQTVWNTGTLTNLTVSGTLLIECTGGGTGVTKTIAVGAPADQANAFNLSLLDTSATSNYSMTGTVANLLINGTQTVTNSTLSIAGDYTYSNANGNTTFSAGGSAWNFVSTNANVRQISVTNAVVHDFPWTFNGVGGNWRITGPVTVGSTRTTTLTNGTLDLNGSNYSTGLFTVNTGTKTLTFNGGRLILSGSGTAWNMSDTANTTLTRGTGNATISMTSSSAKTFAGANLVYPVILDQGGTGNLSVTGNNTFDNLSGSITATANATVFLPTLGNTTFANFSPTGTSSFKLRVDGGSLQRGTVYVAGAVTGNVTGADNLQVANLAFTPFSSDGTNFVRFYLGSNSTFLTGVTGAIAQTYNASTSPKVYVLETGSSWTVPADFNISNNRIHLIGAGGAGQTGTGNARGGGGGGYTTSANFALTPGNTVAFSVGAGGVAPGGNGGQTTFGNLTANGGNGATTTAAGTGGTGLTFNGGNGGSRQGTALTYIGGAGGGGAAGPFGNGAAGGNAVYSNPDVGGSGGGGGGGGTAGAVTAQSNFGAGGNNYAGVGGGTPGSTPGTQGGGGAGMAAGVGTGTPAGPGGWGNDILGLGGGGGGGGGQGRNVVGTPIGYAAAAGGQYGGGGGGGGLGSTNSGAGGAGANGVIIIQYVSTGTPPVVTQNRMFMLF